MAKKERLDVLLVERGLAETRTKAQALILAGAVVVGDQRVDKPGTRVPVDGELRLKGEPQKFVSRGGLKLEGALVHFEWDVRGLVFADIGASTGGFTDCLLQRGAAKVYAIDVGYGQLHEKLRKDPRVVSRERVNARALDETVLPEQVDGLVMDVSFISQTLLMPALVARMKPGALWLSLVKPQFEAGVGHIEKGGVVRDDGVRLACLDKVIAAGEALGLRSQGWVDASVEGPSGNREMLWAARLTR